MLWRLKGLAFLAVLAGLGYLAFQHVPQVHSTVDRYVIQFKNLVPVSLDGGSTGVGEASMAPTEAMTLLASIPVKGKAAATGYSRAQFGEAWTDDNDEQFGRNGCRTREDILARDLSGVTRDKCKVLSGTLMDPYTGRAIDFTRGADSSAAVQIDHVVPLKNAWITGAQQISARDRVNFANDPLNLFAVDGPTNQAKSDGDAATWLPPNKGFRCAYATRQIQVKAKYRLWVTAPEKSAMGRVLSACA
jgi:hypothetical protein